ncbi:MAG: DUF2207 domain-containing protein, partial [Candidatus Diapherotrites archaeon]
MRFKNLALLLVLLFILLSQAWAKSYSLEKAELYYKIEPDGLVKAEEKITFNFSGDFSFAYKDFAQGNWTYGTARVFDITSGTPIELKTDWNKGEFGQRLTWYYSAHNERKTFKIEYTVSRAVKAYSDVGEFYWKVWEEGWDNSLGEIIGYIELPGTVNDAKEVFSWGHPELNGKIGLLENKKLLFQAFNIPANQWVEIRIAFPRYLLSSTKNAAEIGSPGLQKIIEEEKA